MLPYVRLRGIALQAEAVVDSSVDNTNNIGYGARSAPAKAILDSVQIALDLGAVHTSSIDTIVDICNDLISTPDSVQYNGAMIVDTYGYVIVDAAKAEAENGCH